MGNETSSESPKVGYHVLQVQPNSPGKAAGLISFFDFIIAADGVVFDKEDSRFIDTLKNKLGREVKLTVYNSRTESIRETILIPNENWGGSGLAGISIRFCPFENAHENVWHVLDVYPNSPASIAGLQPRMDYIVGTPELLFNESEDFFTLINFNDGKPVPLYVYNLATDEIRLITITPNKKWGGTGSLGCDVGYGILHRIPPLKAAPPTGNFQAPYSVPGHIQAQLPPSTDSASIITPSSPSVLSSPSQQRKSPPPTETFSFTPTFQLNSGTQPSADISSSTSTVEGFHYAFHQANFEEFANQPVPFSSEPYYPTPFPNTSPLTSPKIPQQQSSQKSGEYEEVKLN